jgi:dolichol-phosphate mannosyltransferase
MTSVSLILPVAPGSRPQPHRVAELRRVLARALDPGSLELVIVSSDAAHAPGADSYWTGARERFEDLGRVVTAEERDWSSLARIGLRAATGDSLIVLDLDRQYSPESVFRVLEPVRTGACELAVAVPDPRRSPWQWLRSKLGLGMVSRLFLGTSDAFAGLFAMRRAVWERKRTSERLRRHSVILELLAQRPTHCMDVRVDVGKGFREQGVGFRDVRPLKHLLDARFGNYSRLVQFCMVGASGMAVDLSCYAFLQWALSFTWLFTSNSGLFGVSWHVAAARAVAIAVALVWNFAFNRRLTFNDADKQAVFRQFCAYVVGNALAIAVSFLLSLYLPANVAFFARHKLAAAVVGIVAATAISFSMSRWVVFARRPEPVRPAYVPLEEPVA